MSKSQIKKRKREAEQAGRIDPELNRIRWHRKPQTQVVMNKKAEQRRTQCRRKGSREGADFFIATFRPPLFPDSPTSLLMMVSSARE